jgi:AcrR family transcriptional regulator
VASDARQRLLEAIIGHVQHSGISDLSLRDLASAVGTSHRMLIYHFGSREGVLVAVVQAVEAAQRAFLNALMAEEPELPPTEALRTMWRRFADPSLWPNERLFFELYGQALQSRPGTVGLLDGIIDTWLEPMTAYAIAHGRDPAVAEAEVRLSIAVVRGLLLDLLATRDRAAVDAALERYIEQYEAVNQASDSSAARSASPKGSTPLAARSAER